MADEVEGEIGIIGILKCGGYSALEVYRALWQTVRIPAVAFTVAGGVVGKDEVAEVGKGIEKRQVGGMPSPAESVGENN